MKSEIIWNKYKNLLLKATGLTLVAGLFEFIGVGLLVPIISLVTDGKTKNPSEFTQIVASGLDRFEVPAESRLEAVLLLFLAAIFFKFLFMLAQAKYVHRKLLDVELKMKDEIYSGFVGNSWPHLLTTTDGTLLNALAVETRKLSNFVTSACRIISSSVISFVYLLIAILVSWQILALTTATLLLVYPLVIGLVRRTEALSKTFVTFNNSIMKMVSESLWGMKYLKSVAGLGRFLTQFSRQNATRADVEHRAYIYKQLFALAREPVSLIFAVGLIYWGLEFQDLALSSVLVVGYSVQRLYGQLSLLAGYVNEYKESSPSAELCVSLLEQNRQHRETSGSVEFRELKEKVELKDVRFTYPDGRVALKGVSLVIPKGESVAFVGKSGGGKSTCVDILTGLLRPESGAVTIDGIDQPDLDIESFRKKIGFVPQEPFIVDASVRENVEMGTSLSDEELKTLLVEAHCWEFVETLPDGVETNVGEKGKRLSGGQKQRLALARALGRHPEILILDEPTSALDAESEAFIRETLEGLMGKMTIVIVTHRIGIVESVSRMYEFREGYAEMTRGVSHDS